MVNYRDIKLITVNLRRVDKEVRVSIKKGRYKGYGSARKRNFCVTWYKQRDKYRGVLYSLQRLLASYYGKGGFKGVAMLCNAMLRSPMIRLLCVDKAMSGSGSLTPGPDGAKGLNDYYFVKFCLSNVGYLMSVNHDVKRVYIPKKRGGPRVRPLGLPSSESKCLQMLLLFILLPIVETDTSDRSYGYRAGRSALHATWDVGTQLRKPPGFVMNIDIKGCFDNISHKAIIEALEV